MHASPRSRSLTAALALSGLIASLTVAATTLLVLGVDRQGLLLATRYTARLSFWLFQVIYWTRPLAEATRAHAMVKLVRERRGLGLSFAAAHFVHLAVLVSYFVITGIRPQVATVIVGGFAYVMLAAMAATSSSAAQRRLGLAWKRLHTVGLHTLWAVFILTLILDVFGRGADIPVRLFMIAVSFAGLGLRLTLLMQKRARAA